jgi:glycopeptide antibiotics resistance protein
MLILFDNNDFLVGIGFLCVLLVVLRRQKRSWSYLLFFSIFWGYLLFVVRTVIFPFVINWGPDSPRVLPHINLIPFYYQYCSRLFKYCFIEIVGNVVLTIPFGFGINFLAQVKPRKILWMSVAVGFGFEFSQLVISLVFRSGFRSIDINDVMLNTLGVLFGYALFIIFAWAYIKFSEHFKIEYKGLFADIYAVAIQTRAIDKSKNLTD